MLFSAAVTAAPVAIVAESQLSSSLRKITEAPELPADPDNSDVERRPTHKRRLQDANPPSLSGFLIGKVDVSFMAFAFNTSMSVSDYYKAHTTCLAQMMRGQGRAAEIGTAKPREFTQMEAYDPTRHLLVEFFTDAQCTQAPLAHNNLPSPSATENACLGFEQLAWDPAWAAQN